MTMSDSEIEITKVIEELIKVTSSRLVAVITKEAEGQTVRDWRDNRSEPDDDQKDRLYTLYNIIIMLRKTGDSDDLIKAFIQGMNPELGDLTPAEAIRNGDFDNAWAAAYNYAAIG